ncbi:biofilm development regulator YmgB/AriR family protein [Pantoea sp. Taur]|jgi:Biofilm development protein YmgB/AriR.|uniref:biofilm development regulator YmgB/AriR family protein n=2 Tax=Pantoea TaxID=53335 RepID=UPI000BE32C32|nr:biofilm development regulator YmgB/AriR family protein [Pantoea sp. Taur]MDF7630335.1 biofilm development regulator YmgB/AriR family protein [Erwiniaceae bacterium L1_55_4]MXP53809.1 hypothetical protein [Pantoea sp. Seng]MXP57618.1 hypothetical protein [Pantoea sp. Taur]
MRETNTVAHIQACLMVKGDRYALQKETLDDIIHNLIYIGAPVNNKTIMRHIMNQLMVENNAERQEILRVLLQLIVGYTPDDPGV